MVKKAEFSLLFVIFILLFLLDFSLINAGYGTIVPFLNNIIPLEGFSQITANIFSFILASLVIFTAIIIILERRDPAKTVAWLLILIFVPILGFILYLTFGRQFRKRRMTAKKRILNNYIYPLDQTFACSRQVLSEVALAKEQLIHLIINNAEFPLTLGNDVEVLTNGEEIFPAFLEAMENAQEHIHLETYIMRNDQIGTQITEVLIRKAQAGVKVRVIYDGVGSRQLPESYLTELKNAGIQIEPFFPVRIPFFHNRINYRNHRKILVIDGKIGFVGGVNIGDEYLGRNPKIGHWRETHLRLKGHAVYFLQRIFLQDWYFVSRESLEAKAPLFPDEENKPGDKVVQITASGPDTHWEAIMQVFYYAIATAEKSIYLTSPYFIPNESILTALKTAALSGVETKILLPAKPDHKIVYWAAMSYLEEIMEAGVEVYLYQKGFVHAKVMTIDGVLSTIGSANMDLRSFQLNFEVTALVYNEEVTRHLEKDFANDLLDAQKIDLQEFKKRPLTHQILESALRLLSPLL